jgi:hypothetical protein
MVHEPIPGLDVPRAAASTSSIGRDCQQVEIVPFRGEQPFRASSSRTSRWREHRSFAGECPAGRVCRAFQGTLRSQSSGDTGCSARAVFCRRPRSDVLHRQIRSRSIVPGRRRRVDCASGMIRSAVETIVAKPPRRLDLTRSSRATVIRIPTVGMRSARGYMDLVCSCLNHGRRSAGIRLAAPMRPGYGPCHRLNPRLFPSTTFRDRPPGMPAGATPTPPPPPPPPTKAQLPPPVRHVACLPRRGPRRAPVFSPIYGRPHSPVHASRMGRRAQDETFTRRRPRRQIRVDR